MKTKVCSVLLPSDVNRFYAIASLKTLNGNVAWPKTIQCQRGRVAGEKLQQYELLVFTESHQSDEVVSGIGTPFSLDQNALRIWLPIRLRIRTGVERVKTFPSSFDSAYGSWWNDRVDAIGGRRIIQSQHCKSERSVLALKGGRVGEKNTVLFLDLICSLNQGQNSPMTGKTAKGKNFDPRSPYENHVSYKWRIVSYLCHNTFSL